MVVDGLQGKEEGVEVQWTLLTLGNWERFRNMRVKLRVEWYLLGLSCIGAATTGRYFFYSPFPGKGKGRMKSRTLLVEGTLIN